MHASWPAKSPNTTYLSFNLVSLYHIPLKYLNKFTKYNLPHGQLLPSILQPCQQIYDKQHSILLALHNESNQSVAFYLSSVPAVVIHTTIENNEHIFYATGVFYTVLSMWLQNKLWIANSSELYHLSALSFWYLHMQNPALPVVCLKVKKHVNHKVCCAILICNLLFILANTQTIKKTKLSDQQIRQIAIKVCCARDGACRAKGIFLGTDQFRTETLLQHNKWLNNLEKAKFCSCKLHI